MIAPLEREGRIERWDDTRIRPGSEWRSEIKQALERARAAVLLISADFLASDFIQDNELPPLLSLARVQAKLGNAKEASDLYNVVVRADPTNTEALFGASEAFLLQKDYVTAAEGAA